MATIRMTKEQDDQINKLLEGKLKHPRVMVTGDVARAIKKAAEASSVKKAE